MVSNNKNGQSYIYAIQCIDGSIHVDSSKHPGDDIAKIFSGINPLWSPAMKVIGVKEETANRTVESVRRHFYTKLQQKSFAYA